MSRLIIVACTAGSLAGSTALAQHDQFEPPVRLQAGGEYIDTDIGHAAPYLYDFDGDGTRDLLVGQFGEGKLRIYRNAGSNDKPEYETVQWFKAEHEYGTVPTG